MLNISRGINLIIKRVNATGYKSPQYSETEPLKMTKYRLG